jgi:hypothetical protein
MASTRSRSGRWSLVATAAAVLSCSGSADPLLDPLASRPVTSDAGTAAAPEQAPDQAVSHALPDDGGLEAADTPGSPYVGRGYDLLTDGGSPEADASVSADATLADATAPAAGDGGTRVDSVFCSVTFNVSGAFVDGFVYQAVMVGGDAPALGGWNTAAAPRMTPAGVTPGAWSASVSLQDGETVHFKFGKTSTDGSTIEWEMLPDGDRTLVVSCSSTGAASYTGQYGAAPGSD